MKLIAFHGCFSWLTFRVMNLPLTYTASGPRRRPCSSGPCRLSARAALPGLRDWPA